MNKNTIKNAGIVTAKVAISAFAAFVGYAISVIIAPQKIYNEIIFPKLEDYCYEDNDQYARLKDGKQYKAIKSVSYFICMEDVLRAPFSILSTVGSFVGTYKALNWLEHKMTGKSDNIEQSENDALSISAEDEIEAAGVESDQIESL